MLCVKKPRKLRKEDISAPTKFEHRIHAGYDSNTHEYTGLPKQWLALLRSSHSKTNSVKEVIRGNGHSISSPWPGTETSYLSTPVFTPQLPKISPGSVNSSVRMRRPLNICSPPQAQNGQQCNGIVNDKEAQYQYFLKNIKSVVSSVDDPATMFHNLFQIGEGCTAKVFGAFENKSKNLRAIKIMPLKEQTRRELLFNELFILRGLKHENLVSTLSSHVTGSSLWVVMEFVEGGSLTEIVSKYRLSEWQVATVADQVLTALEFLHSNNIVHRDIKSDSILMTFDGIAKLSDFGFSAKLTHADPVRRSVVGTPYWVAFEVLSHIPYAFECDIWSFGILLVEMVEGEPPYFSLEPNEAIQKILTSPSPTFSPDYKVSSELTEVLRLCVTRDQRIRPNASRLKTHPFFNAKRSPSLLKPLIKPIDIPAH